MKNFFIPIFLIFVLIGCGPEKTVQIKGTLSGSNGEFVYLQESGSGDNVSADTVRLDTKGNFVFKRKISIPTFYSLTVNNRIITVLVHPGDKIIIGGDARHLPLTYSVDGNEDSKHILRLSQRLEHTTFVGDSLDKALQQYAGNRNIVNIQRQLEWNYINEVDSLRAYNIRFLDNNPKSLVSIYALYQQLSPNNYVFGREDDVQYFQRADSFFYKRYPKVPLVKSLHANVLTMNEQQRVRQLNRLLSMLGQDAPEIALPSPDGKIMKLSSGRGKYILLDFWASWSAPCRTENRNLLEAYKKYHDRGFDIYQVSLDQTKTAWERAIKEDGLPWTNVSDFKVWDSEVLKIYGVETIPANFLIDAEGTIISKSLKGDALEKKLSEIFVAGE